MMGTCSKTGSNPRHVFSLYKTFKLTLDNQARIRGFIAKWFHASLLCWIGELHD
jgi:hypothetical protein